MGDVGSTVRPRQEEIILLYTILDSHDAKI